MQLFECQHCGQRLYFENTQCVQCHMALGYIPERNQLGTLTTHGNGVWYVLNEPGQGYRYCANAAFSACNWLVPVESGQSYCLACRHNRTIPDISDPKYLEHWRVLERGKHWLIYSLLRFGLPLVNKQQDRERGLAFDFLAEPHMAFRESAKVVTGHKQGLITVNIAEADDLERERQRTTMAEPYRSVLGHFRHESAHYYWERLIFAGEWQEPFRKLFGDERADYQQALDRHYFQGPPADWTERFVSLYASAHPWEDWAETWAHYFHIVDVLETAYAFGLKVNPSAGGNGRPSTQADFDPYLPASFEELIDAWLPITYAVNCLNRSMGQPDLYPFILPPPALEKLRFVHEVIRHHSSRGD